MELKIIVHDLRENPKDLPPFCGEMHADRKPILAYTEMLGWTSALRFKRGKKAEWYCSNYDGNTIFFDNEIIAWAEMPILRG